MVGGLLAATSWFSCRRSMYAQVREEANLLARIGEGDVKAMQEYQAKLEARAAKAAPRNPE